MSLNPVAFEWTNNSISPANVRALGNGTFLRFTYRNEGKDLYGQLLDTDGSLIRDDFFIKSFMTADVSVAAAALTNGRIAVSWTHNTDGWGAYEMGTQIFNADGTAGGSAIDIGAGASYGVMAGLANGGYAMTYYRTGSGAKNIAFDSNGVAGPEISIGTSAQYDVAGLKGGGHVSVWSTGVGLEWRIDALLRKANGQDVQISVTAPGRISEEKVIALANGNFVVAWRDGVGGGNALKARIYSPEGVATGGEIILYQNSAASAEELDIKPLLDGGFALAFTVSSADSDIYLGTYSATGSTVSAPVMIHDDTRNLNESNPSILTLNDGRYLVDWKDAEGRVHYQAYDPRTAGVSLSGDNADDRYSGSQWGDTLSGAGGHDRLIGNGGNDFITGGLGNDLLNGGAGADTAVFSGRRSDYTVTVLQNGSYAVTDARAGGDGQDTILDIESFQFADGTLSLTQLLATPGGTTPTGGLKLVGTKKRDVLTGGDGNDQLYGKAGKDVLTGNAGQDIFVFDTRPNKKTNLDTITDFSVAEDTIWLSDSVFKKLGKGTEASPTKLKKAFFKMGKAKDKNDYLVYNKKTGMLSYDVDGSGAAKAVEIAKLAKNLKLTQDDFFIV
jgi:Ca2+-binding RTX toxin-like protein